MKMNTTTYLAALAIAIGAGIGVSAPVESADNCAACRASYLSCIRSAGNNAQLRAWCTLNYETCMDRC
jgi:hypothetical protein